MATSIMYSNKSRKNPYFSSRKRLTIAALILLLGTFLTFETSKTAQAGLVSFLSMMLGNQQVSAETSQSSRTAESQVSQTIVLSAPTNPNYLAYAPELQLPPIDDSTTLSPEISRMNTTVIEPVNTRISTYVVRSGDTISGVAQMFNVSVNTILWANNLTSKSVLKEGQNLVILPVTGVSYTVKSNDTIQGIAQKFKADVDDILNYNDLTIASKLKIGDVLLIPNAEVTAPVAASSGKTSAGTSYPSLSGYFSCPVPGSRVTQKIHGSNAVDLAAALGTPIYASAGGTVIINRANGAWNGGYGNFIVILHPNGTQTLYSHMSRSAVTSGETVSRGEVVGYIGLTGLTTGPHLHFEVRGAKNPFSDPAACR